MSMLPIYIIDLLGTQTQHKYSYIRNYCRLRSAGNRKQLKKLKCILYLFIIFYAVIDWLIEYFLYH